MSYETKEVLEPVKRKRKETAEKYDTPERISDLDDDALLEKLKKWVSFSYSFYNDFINKGRDNIRFLYVDQWLQNWRASREVENVPTLEFNHIRVMLDTVMGEYKGNIPDVILTSKVDPQDKLDWLNGLAKQICYTSAAEKKYSIALRNALECGWGYLKAVIAYENNDSFFKCIHIDTNRDFQVAFWDPCAQEDTGEDGDYCGDYSMMSLDDFKRKFNFENPVSAGEASSYFQWQVRDSVTIANIWYKDYFKKTLVKLSDGREMDLKEAKKLIQQREEELENMTPEIMAQMQLIGIPIPESLEIVAERDALDYTIKHVRFVQNGILDKADWPGKHLPIIRNIGEMAVVEGNPTPLSFMEDAQDAQMLYNYQMSEIARGLVNAHKSPVMATDAMIAGHEQQWRQPNQVQGVLKYNVDPLSPDGKPIFLDPTPFNQSLIPLQQIISQEMNTIMGRYEESHGEQSNAISSLAIQKRKDSANTVIKNYFYNNERAIERLWVVIVDLLPHVYSEENREVEIRDDKGKPSRIMLNKRTGRMKVKNGFNSLEDLMGGMEEEIEHKVDHDAYSIEVKVAGSFDEQTQKSLELILRACTSNPAFWPLVADIFMGMTGLEKSKVLAERVKIMLPPEVKALESGEPPPPPQPDPMLQVEQGKLQVEMMKAEVSKMEMQSKMQMNSLNAELEKEKIINERLKLQIEAQANHIDSSVSLAEAQADLEKIKIKSESELQKGLLGLKTAHVVHNTNKMKQIGNLLNQKNKGE